MDRRRFYDWLSTFYGFVGLFDNYYKKKALDDLELSSGQKFLDVGCGDGYVLMSAKENYPNCEFFGVDFSVKMVGRASEKVSGHVSLGDCFGLPYRSNSFDALFSSFVFDLFDDGNQRRVLTEFKRVLLSGGRLVLVNNTRGGGFFFLLSGFYVFLSRLFSGVILNRPIDARSIIEESGYFEVVSRRIVGFTEILVCKKVN